MGMTLAEKILARASGRDSVFPDQIVIAKVDLAMSHENADLVRKSFLEIGLARVWDPSKIVIVFDHRIPAESEKTATTHKAVREFVAAQGIDNAVQRISGHAVNSLYSHLNKCFDNHLGYGWHLFPPSPWLGLWISRTYLNPAVREKQPFISACFLRGNLGAPFAGFG